MGCTASLSQEEKENRKIESVQQKAQDENSRLIKILLFGTGDSGKTTLRKQLVNIHSKKLENVSERKSFARVILMNLIEGALAVLAAIPDNGSYQATIADLKSNAVTEDTDQLTPEAAESLKKLIYEDEVFKQTLEEKKSSLNMQPCWYNFAESLKDYPKWGGKDWVPTSEECIRSRARTSGVVKEEFTINTINFQLIDVGGQRSERKKWMHNFDDMTAAIFVTAISEYDENLFEDANKNRLQEAFDLFSESFKSPWLKNTTILLFLNKKDLFDKKFLVDKIPLNKSGKFPTAPEGNTDTEPAIKWVTHEFQLRKDAAQEDKTKMFTHVTTATDPKNITIVFGACRDVILNRNLANAGFQ